MSSQALPSGLRTPTSHGFMPLPLGTPGAGQPTTGVTVGDAVGTNTGMGFGLHEPPKMRKAMSKGDGINGSGSRDVTPPDDEPANENGGGSGSTGSSVTSKPGLDNGSSHHSNAPRGTLSVKLISARGLAVSHSADANPQPYVVIQFEQNEFVSRPPHPVASPASVPFTTSQAQPKGNSTGPGNLTRSTSGLGVSTITRAFAEAVGRGTKKKDSDDSGMRTPRAEEPVGGMSWLGKPGPGDPVWKEEVAL